MCILCNTESLRLLIAPLASLSHPQLAEAIQTSREAAMQLVLDTADTLDDFETPDDALRSLGADEYVRYVVDRAERDGVADADEVRAWDRARQEGSLLVDPRVQAFISASTEGLATYLAQIQDKQMVLERFLEVPMGDTRFDGIGPSGEIAFDYGGEKHIVLTEDEAMQIAVDYITDDLWQEDTALLLQYTSLPDDAVDILATAQRSPRDKANDILAGIVDVAALAADAVRQSGYGRFVAEGWSDDFVEQRFGDLVIIRMRVSDAPHEES